MINKILTGVAGGLEALFFVLFIIVLMATISSFLVMIVWNLVIPSIFVGAPLIGFWQALGLWVLGSLLTGSSSGSSSSSN